MNIETVFEFWHPDFTESIDFVVVDSEEKIPLLATRLRKQLAFHHIFHEDAAF